MNDPLLVGQRVAEPHLGLKPLLAEQQPGLLVGRDAEAREASEAPLAGAEAATEARTAAPSGDAYAKLLAEGRWHGSKDDWRRAATAYREAIALRPDAPEAYHHLGGALSNSGHFAEAARRHLEAAERSPMDSKGWAGATAWAFDVLRVQACAEAAKPEWWNDEALKVLSARVLQAAPNDEAASDMRAMVLSGEAGGWEAGPRSVAELEQAAALFDRSAALCRRAPAWRALLSEAADWCRRRAEAEAAVGGRLRRSPLSRVRGS